MFKFSFQKDNITIRFGFAPSSDVLLMFNTYDIKPFWVTLQTKSQNYKTSWYHYQVTVFLKNTSKTFQFNSNSTQF